jgi:hypothetical protein
MVKVLPCMAAGDEVGRGGIWASVVTVGGAKLIVMAVRGDDVDSGTGVISVNSSQVVDNGEGSTGVTKLARSGPDGGVMGVTILAGSAAVEGVTGITKLAGSAADEGCKATSRK